MEAKDRALGNSSMPEVGLAGLGRKVGDKAGHRHLDWGRKKDDPVKSPPNHTSDRDPGNTLMILASRRVLIYGMLLAQCTLSV